MAQKVADGLVIQKKIFIDLRAVGHLVDGLKKQLVTAKKIFIDLRLGSRVRAAFTSSVRFLFRKWRTAGGVACLFVLLSNTATISDNFWKVYDGGMRLLPGNSSAEIRKQKEAYEEAESIRLYDVISKKKAPLKLAIDNANIMPSKRMVLDAYRASPGSETVLVALHQSEVVKLLRTDSAAAAAANDLLDEMDQAIACRTDRCDTGAFDRDWNEALCKSDAVLRGWIDWRRANQDPSFAMSFTKRVDDITCQPYLYEPAEPAVS